MMKLKDKERAKKTLHYFVAENCMSAIERGLTRVRLVVLANSM